MPRADPAREGAEAQECQYLIAIRDICALRFMEMGYGSGGKGILVVALVVAVADDVGEADLAGCCLEGSSPSASMLSRFDSTAATALDRKDPHLEVEGAAMAEAAIRRLLVWSLMIR